MVGFSNHDDGQNEQAFFGALNKFDPDILRIENRDENDNKHAKFTGKIHIFNHYFITISP